MREIWQSRQGICVISLMKLRIEGGMLTTLVLIILKNCLSSWQASWIKLIISNLSYPFSLICFSKNFFISMLLFSQSNWRNLNVRHRAI